MSNIGQAEGDQAQQPGAPKSVLVVGAGPVGLVAACELARHGVVPRLIDQLPERTTQYRAVGVQPRSQEMLATLGVLDRLQARSLPQRAIEIDVASAQDFRTLARVDLTNVPSRYPMIVNVPQTETEAVLRERADELGITIEHGTALANLDSDDRRVDVVLRTDGGEEHARFDWVIGADGGHSAVRKAVGSRLRGRFHGSHFVVADVHLEGDFAPDTTRLFAATHGGLTVMMCMQQQRVRLMFQVPAPAPDMPQPTLEDVQRLAATRMGSSVRVYDPESIGYYSIHHAQVPRYRVGRVFLAGDAAHIHSPAGGQGMNTGMQDAANLAWKLALVCRGVADPALLDSYHAERHPVGASVVRRTTLMASAMTLSGWRGRVRNRVIEAAARHRSLRRALAVSTTETSVAYPWSPIVVSSRRRPRTAAVAGSYVPDVPALQDIRGHELHLGDLLRRPGHILLALTDDPDTLDRLRAVVGGIGAVVPVVDTAAAATADTIIDPSGSVGARLGIGECGLALIRPDGYIGYLSPSTDPVELSAYLRERLHLTDSNAIS